MGATSRPISSVGLCASVGAVGLIIGSFLPWATNAGLYGSTTTNGMDADGKVTLAAGVLTVIMLVIGSVRPRQFVLLIGCAAAAVGGWVTVRQLIDIGDRANRFAGDAGTGLYVCLGGAIAALVLGMVAQSTPPVSSPENGEAAPDPKVEGG